MSLEQSSLGLAVPLSGGAKVLEIRAHRVIEPNLLRALSPAEIDPEVDATISDIEGLLMDPASKPADIDCP